MIFVNVNAGHYLILEDDRVVATVKRRYVKLNYYEYAQAYYDVVWKDPMAASETFRTLADIQEAHQFSNYGGYNKVLTRKGTNTEAFKKRVLDAVATAKAEGKVSSVHRHTIPRRKDYFD
jgi:predicted N-acyltransferase